jgi:hypothetical protein
MQLRHHHQTVVTNRFLYDGWTSTVIVAQVSSLILHTVCMYIKCLSDIITTIKNVIG